MGKSVDQQPVEPKRADESSGWPAWQRTLVSIALLIHLAAVIAPPLNFATVGSGPARQVYQLLRPYSQAAYVDHGYFFFAPDPGASHLVRFRAEFEDDREPLVDMFPDKKKQWPRLLYHRHFMLTEHLHAAYADPTPPPNLDDRGIAEWRAARDIYEARWRGFQQHLKTKYNAKQVTLTRVQHRPPDPLEFLDGVGLDDERLYRDLPETPENQGRAGRGAESVPANPPLLPNGPMRPDPRAAPSRSNDDVRPPPFLERIDPTRSPAPLGPQP